MEKIINKEEDALVVAHNFIIAVVICRIRNISLNELLSTCVGNASKTIISFQKDGMFIETFDDRSHLLEDIKSSG